MKKLLFVYNPKSGKGKIKACLADIIDIFTKYNYEVTAYPTQFGGDCARKIEESAYLYDMVVVSGGDGTLNECVSGMVKIEKENRVPIGYIPAGTMNDFAAGHGIPRDMTDAAKNIMEGKLVKSDIGVFNSSGFIYVAGFGAFTEVSYDTPQIQKTIFGNAAYVMEGIKSLARIEGVRVKVTTDEGVSAEEEVLICLVLNTPRVAGFQFSNFYDVDMNDGLFEIVLISKSNKLTELPAMINNIKNGRRDGEGVRVISTAGADIETEKPVKWTLDGEYGGECSKTRISVMHDAVQFIAVDTGDM